MSKYCYWCGNEIIIDPRGNQTFLENNERFFCNNLCQELYLSAETQDDITYPDQRDIKDNT